MVGARNHDRNNKVSHRPLVMSVGTCDVNRQRCTALVDQEMNLRTTFAAVGGIAPGRRATQRGSHRFAVDSLPFPADFLLAMVEPSHGSQHLVPDALLLPCLEPLVQDTARNVEPIAVDGFPLAACPQNVPEPIDDGPIISGRSPWPAFLGRFGQMIFDAAPQGARDAEIVDIFGLLFILVLQDAPRWMFVFGQTNCPRGASFV